MKQAHPGYSLRRICAVLHVSRSSLSRPERRARQRARAEPDLEQKVLVLIQEHPTYGYRRLWALLQCHREHVIDWGGVERLDETDFGDHVREFVVRWDRGEHLLIAMSATE